MVEEVSSERTDLIMGTSYYLAYGSNLNKKQMKLRCPTAKVVGTAEIKDFTLRFRGSRTGAYLTIEKQYGSAVPVAVWAVTGADVKALDRYEGYPNFYYKKTFTLEVNGSPTECFAYIMHEYRPLGIPTKRYVETCIEGYGDFGFDKRILIQAVRESRCKAYEK